MTMSSSTPIAGLQPEQYLRRVLLVDAVTSLAAGALSSLAAGPLATLTRLPPDLLFYSGLSLIPVAAFMLLVAAQRPPAKGLLLAIILGNVGWVLGCLLVLVDGKAMLNAVGVAFVLAQAMTVAVLAVLEAVGLRRLP